MKIIQVLASTGDGGLEKHVRDLSQALIDAGNEVIIFADIKIAPSLPQDAKVVAMRFDRSRFNPILLWQLYVNFRRFPCDIIHAQANKAVALVGLLRLFLRCPTVGTLHNTKRSTRSFNKLDHVISVSETAAKCLNHPSCSVILNGITPPSNIRRLDLAKLFNLPENMPILCAVGRLVPAKGFDVLLDAIDGLPVTLIIAGEGPERSVLQTRISNLKSPTSCTLLGYRRDAMDIMFSADGLVISSIHEGFPYVLVEALMAGSRILTTDISNVRDFLPDDLIVPPDNSSALRTGIMKLIHDMNKWESLMKNPREFAQAKLTLEAMKNQTQHVYDLLTGDRPLR